MQFGVLPMHGPSPAAPQTHPLSGLQVSESVRPKQDVPSLHLQEPPSVEALGIIQDSPVMPVRASQLSLCAAVQLAEMLDDKMYYASGISTDIDIRRSIFIIFKAHILPMHDPSM